MNRLSRILTGAAVAMSAAAPLQAQISWTDWLSASSGSATGSMTIGSTNVGVNYTGGYGFVQTGCGTNYWTNPTIYQGAGVPNAPPGCDIVALSGGGTKTLTFSHALLDPVIALVSWNGQPPAGIVFSSMLEFVNEGRGYWGDGTMSVAGNTLFVSGEAHGTIRVKGSLSSITFTDGSEFWHGLTVGAASLAPPTSAVPEPATVVLMGTGLAGLAFAARRRRR